MKYAICYYSRHHGNTRKLAEAVAAGKDVELIDVTARAAFHPERYDAIGFASGVYFGKFHETVIDFLRRYLPEGARTFFLYTGGNPGPGATALIRKAAAERNAVVLGAYGCRGYDTFGPFKLVGGIARGHPDEAELREARAFFENTVEAALAP